MKRIDRIYSYLQECTKNLSKEQILEDTGFEASEISGHLQILRNNVSKELNELLRLNKIIKIKGKPVKFLDRGGVETILGISLKRTVIGVAHVKELLVQEAGEDPFQYLIGADTSLQNQVEQAKAAIIYPSGGLHTLIFGQTGVGKTLFAKMMYNYGKYIKKFTDSSPFIIFNCADYYNNPQLLLSHIFGHVKGAFTGADQEKDGLVGKANGGILFLDEIHRLSPEGQEMIFYFMDTGIYNKLGETERKRKANVLIIGATTEDPNLAMLKTFIRRIPVIITIPSLQERTIEEKLEILKYLFVNEAHRVNKSIKISAEVIKALIGSVSYGNIGQLKSNIQITCARGFLGSINSNKDCIELDFATLPANIKNGLFEVSRNRDLTNMVNSQLLVQPDGYKNMIEDSYELPINLYKLIEDKLRVLKMEGVDDNYINTFINTDVNTSIKKFYAKFDKDKKIRERILKIIDREILEVAEKVRNIAEKRLNRRYSERFIYALSFHLSALLKRIKEKKYEDQMYMGHSVPIDNEEYQAALDILSFIRQTFKVDVPDVEIKYIAILLSSVEDERQGKVAVIVAAHGENTASSMVNVVKKLLDDVSVCAIDMPLDVNPKEILDAVIEKVKSMSKGKGVLLLVDMGSLMRFEETIIERTGVKVKTIDMVSTPLVLEAVRKSTVFDMDLEDIYHSLREFRGYTNNAVKRSAHDEQIIITVCSSGKGTATKLKEIVGEVILDITDKTIHIVPVGIRELDKRIKELQAEHAVLAVVGVKKSKENIPFIPLEELINGTGEKMLRKIITGGPIEEFEETAPKQSIVVRDMCENNFQQFLLYLNPKKIIGILLEFVNILETRLHVKYDNPMKMRIILHVGYSLERMIIREGLTCKEEKVLVNEHIMQAVDYAAEVFTKALNISLTEDEKYYICRLID